MKISFIISNFNYGQFVEGAIRSIVAQDAKGIEKELFLIDDGSTDHSVIVFNECMTELEQHFDSLCVFFHKSNRGKLYRLNQAIPLVCGDFTVILDSDDYLSTNFLSETLNAYLSLATQTKNLGFVYTDSLLIDQDDTIFAKGLASPFEAKRLMIESFIPECALTVTEALVDAYPFNANIRRGTKHHKWIKVSESGWVGSYLPRPLFYYRMHSANLSGIGTKILSEISNNDLSSHKLLSGYWDATG